MAKDENLHRQYHVQSYDPTWPEQFKSETKNLESIFGKDAVAIEHIGSTSVVGMDAKPTIDILILVNDLSVVGKHVGAMKAAGYECLANYVLPDTVFFRRIKRGAILYNVHVFAKDHPHVVEMISLRDYLRSNPDEAMAYSKIKMDLFEKYPNDYFAYRKLKDAYMTGLKDRVKSRYGF